MKVVVVEVFMTISLRDDFDLMVNLIMWTNFTMLEDMWASRHNFGDLVLSHSSSRFASSFQRVSRILSMIILYTAK